MKIHIWLAGQSAETISKIGGIMGEKLSESQLVVGDQVTISQLTANWGSVLKHCQDHGPVKITRRGIEAYVIQALHGTAQEEGR
jgi:hypothetical protein